MGCAVIGWAEVYAYWKQYNGASRLFDGIDLFYGRNWHYEGSQENYIDNRGEVYRVMSTIRCDMQTKNGATYVGFIPDGKKYGQNKGYTVDVKWLTSWYYNDIRDYIKNNKPVLLHVASAPGTTGVYNHIVVIEAVKRRYWTNTGDVLEVGYEINPGHGDNAPKKWMYLFIDTANKPNENYDPNRPIEDNGRPKEWHYMWDAYLIDIR